MVKERSYKILEQLDEYELQEATAAGGSGAVAYDSDSGDENELTHEQRVNVVPSALDSDHDDSDDDGDDDDGDDDVPEFTDAVSSQANPATTTSQATAAAVAVASSSSSVPNPTDGVFANMSAKPDLYLGFDDKIPNEPLPTYQDIYGPQSSAAPPYFEAAVISVGDEDELLVEGLPVGSFGVFIINMVVSAAFQVVGYMLTFLLHSSHAAKDGSLAGLGITFINFGLYIRTHAGENIFEDIEPPNGGGGHPPAKGNEGAATPLDNSYFAYFLIVIGAGIFIKAVYDYIRVRNLQTIIESSPEENV